MVFPSAETISDRYITCKYNLQEFIIVNTSSECPAPTRISIIVLSCSRCGFGIHTCSIVYCILSSLLIFHKNRCLDSPVMYGNLDFFVFRNNTPVPIFNCRRPSEISIDEDNSVFCLWYLQSIVDV